MDAKAHYDYLADHAAGSAFKRDEGPLAHQFEFNNWVKSILIQLATPHQWADGLLSLTLPLQQSFL